MVFQSFIFVANSRYDGGGRRSATLEPGSRLQLCWVDPSLHEDHAAEAEMRTARVVLRREMQIVSVAACKAAG